MKNCKATIVIFLFLLGYADLGFSEKSTVRIGVIVPLSGDMALHGKEIQRAMHLAMQDGSQAKRYYDYSLLFEDNQLQAARSVSAAQKLIHIDKVDAIVTLWPPTALAVLPLTDRAGILHYTIAWDPNLARDHALLLSHQVMVDRIARATLRLFRHEGKSRVAFLHMEETGFNLGSEHIRELAVSEGIKLVTDETFQPGDTDFRALVHRAASNSPDSYLIWAVMPSLDILIRQIRTVQPHAFVSGYFDYAQDEQQIAGAPYISEMFSAQHFGEKYYQAYGSYPISKGPNAFDIANLLVQAFESSPNTKLHGFELKNYLTHIRDFPGAVGNFSIDEFGNSSYSPVVRQIARGNRVLAKINLGLDSD